MIKFLYINPKRNIYNQLVYSSETKMELACKEFSIAPFDRVLSIIGLKNVCPYKRREV